MERFTDLVMERDEDGIMDFVIDTEAKDFKLTGGMDSAIFISIFTDRRARPDEVANPMKRNGWTGDDHEGIIGETWGSGIWLYNQSRSTVERLEGIRMEAFMCMGWGLTEKLVQSIDVNLSFDARTRTATIDMHLIDDLGINTSHSYELWASTPEKTTFNN